MIYEPKNTNLKARLKLLRDKPKGPYTNGHKTQANPLIKLQQSSDRFTLFCYPAQQKVRTSRSQTIKYIVEIERS